MYTSNDIVSQRVRVQNNVHSIAVPQEHSMSIARGAKLKVEGVGTIYIYIMILFILQLCKGTQRRNQTYVHKFRFSGVGVSKVHRVYVCGLH